MKTSADSLIREYVSLILREAPAYPMAAAGLLPQLSANSRLSFGVFGSAQDVFEANDDSKLVLKLASKPGLSIDYAKLNMDARSVPPGYLVKTSRFMKDLSKNLSPEALSRQQEIILATTDDAVKKTKPFNSTESFYVLVDIYNKNIVNDDLMDVYETPALKQITTLLSNPGSGLGKIINSLPEAERTKVIKLFNDVAAIGGVVGGGTGILSLLGSSVAQIPQVKAASVAAASISIGPMLALSSVAYDKGNNLECFMYLFFALMGGVAAWHETITVVSLVNKTVPASQNAFQLIAKRKVSKLEDLLIFFENLQKLFPTYASWQMKRSMLGNIGTFQQEFIEFFMKHPDILLSLEKSIKDNLSSVAKILSFTFGAGVTTWGLTSDIETLNKKLNPESSGTNINDSDIKTESVAFVGQFMLNVHEKMSNKMKSKSYQSFYDAYRKSGYTACINASSDNLDVSYYPKVTIDGKKPDFVVTTKENFDVFGTLIKYPTSIVNNKNILPLPTEDGGRSIYIIPAVLVTQQYQTY